MNSNVKSKLDSYVEKISNVDGVLQIYLFGSYVYGTPHEHSDLDLMVIVDDIHNAIRKATEINIKLAEVRGIAPDISVNRKTDFEKAREKPTFQKTIGDRGVLLYGA
jgi:predicted nucleotidyltransferase